MMRKLLMFLLFMLVLPCAPAAAQNVATAKYETKESMEKAWAALLQALPSQKFSVRSASKTDGSFHATRMGSGPSAAKEFASLFGFTAKDGDTVTIEITFTRNPGFMGGGKPEEWAKKIGETMKKTLPDLTVVVTTPKI
jgi:hypothetical protein